MMENKPNRKQRRASKDAHEKLRSLMVRFLETIQKVDIKSEKAAYEMDKLDSQWKDFCAKKKLTHESFKAFSDECQLIIKKIEEFNENQIKNEGSIVS